jgi:hypothetical protein
MASIGGVLIRSTSRLTHIASHCDLRPLQNIIPSAHSPIRDHRCPSPPLCLNPLGGRQLVSGYTMTKSVTAGDGGRLTFRGSVLIPEDVQAIQVQLRVLVILAVKIQSRLEFACRMH